MRRAMIIVCAGLLAGAGCKKDAPSAKQAPAGEDETAKDTEAATEAGRKEEAVGPIDAAPDQGTDDGAAADRLRGFAVANGLLWRVTPPVAGEAVAEVGREKIAEVGAIAWCEVDPAARVVWYHGEGGVHAYDTETGKTHDVIRHPKSGAFESVVISYEGKAQVLQSADGLNTDTAVKLTMAPPAKVEPYVLCHGDREVYCYESQEGDDPKKWKLAEAAQAGFDRAKEAKLDDPAFAKLAYERAAAFKPAKPPQAPKATSITIDKARCKADEDSCGDTSWVGGRFWLVTTDNDRGDFYHQTEQLYDSRSKEFVNPDGWVRSRKPYQYDQVGSVTVVSSLDRHFAFVNGSLIDLNTGKYLWGRGETIACGWL